MIVCGAFGTGKTKCISLAAERIIQQTKFFSNWSVETNKKALRLVRDPLQADRQGAYSTESCLPMTKFLEKHISDSNLVVTWPPLGQYDLPYKRD